MPIRTASLLTDPFSPKDTAGNVLDPFGLNKLDVALERHEQFYVSLDAEFDRLLYDMEVKLYGIGGRPGDGRADSGEDPEHLVPELLEPAEAV